MPRQVCLITPPQQIKIARAACDPPAKNARMGDPLWESCTQTSLKVAHPPFGALHATFPFGATGSLLARIDFTRSADDAPSSDNP
jgi:hypothetical protein